MIPRNWKWMMPAVLMSLFLLIAYFFLISPFEWVRLVGLVPVTAAVVCAVAAIGNFWDYRREAAVSLLERRRAAEGVTQLSVRLEAARGVHPDVVRRLIEEAHRVWALKAGNRDMRIPAHSVLYHAPDVTDFFVVYVLRNSSEQYVMGKRLLTEGRKNKFDPWSAVDEYTMFDSLMRLWAAEGRVIKYSEWEPYAWVQPWNPQVVADDYGLDISAEENEQPVDGSLEVKQ